MINNLHDLDIMIFTMNLNNTTLEVQLVTQILEVTTVEATPKDRGEALMGKDHPTHLGDAMNFKVDETSGQQPPKHGMTVLYNEWLDQVDIVDQVVLRMLAAVMAIEDKMMEKKMLKNFKGAIYDMKDHQELEGATQPATTTVMHMLKRAKQS